MKKIITSQRSSLDNLLLYIIKKNIGERLNIFSKKKSKKVKKKKRLLTNEQEIHYKKKTKRIIASKQIRRMYFK